MTLAAPVKRRWPSAGWWLILVSYAAALLFLGWGYRRPRLDRLWEQELRLKTGELYELSASERKLLTGALDDYPRLASSMLGAAGIAVVSQTFAGWAETPAVTIARTPNSRSDALRFQFRDAEGPWPRAVSIAGETWRQRLTVEGAGPHAVQLPTPGPTSEVITLRFEWAAKEQKHGALAIAVSFPDPALATKAAHGGAR